MCPESMIPNPDPKNNGSWQMSKGRRVYICQKINKILQSIQLKKHTMFLCPEIVKFFVKFFK